MSDKFYIGGSVDTLETSPKFEQYTGVRLLISDDESIFVGNTKGRVMEVPDMPWGTKAMAENILASLGSYRYQPFTADNASIDPAAELGDGVTVGGIYSAVYEQGFTYNGHLKATFSAPSDEAIDHEIPYKPRTQRRYTRYKAETKAKLTVQAGLISAEVTARTTADEALSGRIDVEAGRITAEVTARGNAIADLTSKLEVQAGLISAKVSQTGGAEDGSFEYEIRPTYALWKSNGTELLRLEAGKAVLHGDIYAENGIFAGEVHAGKITYGEKDGYFNGGGLSPGTVTGGQYGKIALGGNGVGTLNVTPGVSTSLGYADISHKVFTEGSTAVYLYGTNVWAQSVFWFRGYQAVVKTINGQTVLGLQLR